MITMFLISCDAPKNNFGYVSIDDEKSRNVVKIFEAVEDEEIGFLKEIFSKDLEFKDPNGTILNKDEFIAGVENIKLAGSTSTVGIATTSLFKVTSLFLNPL